MLVIKSAAIGYSLRHRINEEGSIHTHMRKARNSADPYDHWHADIGLLGPFPSFYCLPHEDKKVALTISIRNLDVYLG